MEKVSVIIPTFNRFEYLLNTIESVKKQTYNNLEIIVVNDKSTQKEYYNYDWGAKNITIIHLDLNSKQFFGYACAGYVRNKGIEISKGKYIAFCDDDDIWFPKKLELQINAMEKSGCKMSSTDGLIGYGVYDENKIYMKYNEEHFFDKLYKIYEPKINIILSKIPILKNIIRKNNMLENRFPKIWTLDFLKIHNCVICSSVLMEKIILDKINNFKNLKNGREDYDCWLRALKHTNSVYVIDACFYYDGAHGDGQNY
tara:strand:- start:23 stop:790 length:768 start_codon:yes stop_codon:yes gene_type:complete